MTTITILLAGILFLNVIRLCLALRQAVKLGQLEKRQQCVGEINEEWQKMEAGFLADEISKGV